MSSQLLGPTPLVSVVATSVNADQRISLNSLGTVTAVESSSATGYSLSLVDSAGAGSSIPVLSVTSSGGPPITAAQITTSAATVNILDDAATPTGLRISQGAGTAVLSMTDASGAGSNIAALTFTSTGGPPATAVQIAANAPLNHPSALQSGTGTLAAGTLAVANTAITASSVVMVTQTGAAINATVALSVTVSAGVGFTVNGPTGSTATFAWFVARY